MKTKLSMLLVALLTVATGTVAQARQCDDGSDPDVIDVSLALITTTTLPPLTTTTLIACGILDNAEANKAMILREATLVNEENKAFVPSFLGAYADQNGMDIRTAAQDVLVHGVR